MKVLRTKHELIIKIPESDEEVEIRFPDTFKARVGNKCFEIKAYDLEYIISLLEHYLARLACNALEAERTARRTGKPRSLVYDPETGVSMETALDIGNFPFVDYHDWVYEWTNPGEHDHEHPRS